MPTARIAKPTQISGNLEFPAQWTVFAPLKPTDDLAPEQLNVIPEALEIDGKRLAPHTVVPTRNQYDFKTIFGDPPYRAGQTAWVFATLDSPTEQEVTLGAGADWCMEIRVNGELLLDTRADGNKTSPPSIDNFRFNVPLRQGRNILAVRFTNGQSSAVLALGGPEELRYGDFTSILPPKRPEDAASLAESFPPDPDAPIKWIAPDTFDPTADGLGFPQLKAAEHFELLHALPSRAALEDGGDGVYESMQHGTWNHGIRHLAVFQDRLIALWNNHAIDEGGPASRMIGKVGRIVNEEGEVDWGGPETFIEPGPAPVPVRRRKIDSDRDKIRGTKVRGDFQVVGDRLLFSGHLLAKHGATTEPGRRRPEDGDSMVLPPEHFYFGKTAEAPGAAFIDWDLGFRFHQEWALIDGRLQPVSPLYKENELAEELALTTELSLPLEPLIQPYRDAPHLKTAPEDFQDLVRRRPMTSNEKLPRFRPGTRHLTEDGTHNLIPTHSAEFRRPDGSQVVVIDNGCPFYYAAEKPDAESFYPPPRRTSLYGAIKPTAGELPDGRPYIIGNSPRRRDMYLMLSRDGRTFDTTWLLMHQQIQNTPGAMKSQGGPGSGPQYFKSHVAGRSLWMVYSISKEHIGATRVPLAALK